MASYKITVFAGDHCGPEVTNEAVKVLQTLSKTRPAIGFDLQDQLLGGVSHSNLSSIITTILSLY